MKMVKMNQKLHNSNFQFLIVDVGDRDVVKEILEPNYIDIQTRLI